MLGSDELVDDLTLSRQQRRQEPSAVGASWRAKSAHTCSDLSEMFAPWRTTWPIRSWARWRVGSAPPLVCSVIIALAVAAVIIVEDSADF